MGDLPSGTVSMMFSDIEGSTLLLSRLGPKYLAALDGHRRIMRQAWVAHAGTEVGTEGDSFFVVFRTAGAAVNAAIQAQRGLEGHPWPSGETIRVRIGIHTGSPQVHEDDYWGMDVHRAARIAAAAHGGQVVMSGVTAELARAELQDGVVVRDLGLHRLKDIPGPEHLFQLTVDGLQQDFPALRTLGTSSSLPHPATPMIGRERDVGELTLLPGERGARLVTLTGPGGSGKTRLAIGVAELLVSRFADGVFFVPLAAVTTAEVMWTSMAEALDVPARERTPARFLNLVGQRSLLLVLDNLEQVEGADEVVENLLDAAPSVSIVVTSRQPLGLPAERRYPVAPLSLPEDATPGSAQESSAVQLFMYRARSVNPGFELSSDNVRDVVAICRRLDGLPLAIELAASRIRVLGPKALLRRLDQALDIASTGRLVPARQRTLRDTIAWSYDLLTPTQRGRFRRLGVFAGGGDLDAIAAVTSGNAGPSQRADPLETVAELVDASLATVTEGLDGEPRVTLLETIRAFAVDQLRAAGEVEAVRTAHAAHYADLAERLRALRESRHVAALGSAETEMDNFREALGWAVPRRDHPGSRRADLTTGLRLCAALGWVWLMGGYLTEGRDWHERVIAEAAGSPSPGLAACLGGLANLLIAQGESERACDLARQSLTMARSLGDQQAVAFALGVLGTAEQQLGDVEAAHATLQQSLEVHRRLGDQGRLARALGNLAGIEETLGHLDRAEALIVESLELLDGLGDMHEAAAQRQNLAHLLAIAGRVQEANTLARGLIDSVLRLRSPNLTMAFANTYMNILIRSGQPDLAAQLFGAEEKMHERLAIPNPYQEEELEEALGLVAGVMSAEDWQHHRRLGRGKPVEDLLAQLAGASPSP
jgi:predicted ATPase/class 3 adenylate cyclase